jgi:hypothetical protein
MTPIERALPLMCDEALHNLAERLTQIEQRRMERLARMALLAVRLSEPPKEDR